MPCWLGGPPIWPAACPKSYTPQPVPPWRVWSARAGQGPYQTGPSARLPSSDTLLSAPFPYPAPSYKLELRPRTLPRNPAAYPRKLRKVRSLPSSSMVYCAYVRDLLVMPTPQPNQGFTMVRRARRSLFLIAFVIISCGFIGLLFGEKVGAASSGGGDGDIRDSLRTFTQVYNIVEQNYAESVNPDKA